MGASAYGPALILTLLLAPSAGAQAPVSGSPPAVSPVVLSTQPAAVAVSSPTVVAIPSAPAAVDSDALVAASSVAVVVPSTAPANAAGSAQIGSASEGTIPTVAAPRSLQTSAAQAMLDLAAAYSEKRRTLFMKLVSDDFMGDLGTLEDALSSDFRSYRTIVLSIVPGFVTVNGDQASVQFTYNMTITNDLGNNANYAGSAAYVFRREDDGKVRLYKMDSGAQIFGTSLSSIDNPVAKSQGAQTSTPPPGVVSAPAPCSATTLGGSAQINNSSEGFRFSSQSVVSQSAADIYLFSNGGPSPSIDTESGASISDLGPCSFNSFSQDPSSISGTSANVNVGDCYAIRTNAGKYAVIIVTNFNAGGGDGPPPATLNFNYKYQPSGKTCF